MARVRYMAEQIIGKLREAEVWLAKGSTAAQVYKQIGVTEQTYYLEAELQHPRAAQRLGLPAPSTGGCGTLDGPGRGRAHAGNNS